jgi:hypothetical protein
VKHLAFYLCAALGSVPVDASPKPPEPDWAALGWYRAENARVGPPTSSEKRVVFFGDSITEFWSSKAPAFFEGRPYLSRGVGGQTTAQMLVRFRQDVMGPLAERALKKALGVL